MTALMDLIAGEERSILLAISVEDWGGLDDAWLAGTDEGVAFWQMLAHVVNHGTQHRSESAALLTQAGRSPGDLDMIVWLEERAGWKDGLPPSQQQAEGPAE